MFGVEIVYIRDHVARKVSAIVPGGGRGVWALLLDGRVGTNDAEFFKYHRAEDSREGLHIAERLWRLGKMSKVTYQKLDAAWKRREDRKSKKSAVNDFVYQAKIAGIALSKEQQAIVDKMTA
jgi:hypothetical protein